VSRAAKKIPPRPLLDPESLDFREGVRIARGDGMSEKHAARWAALRLAGKLGNARGHILAMCNGSVECCNCSGYGTMSQDAPWELSGELLTKDCERKG
jgi:hypothetical protein